MSKVAMKSITCSLYILYILAKMEAANGQTFATTAAADGKTDSLNSSRAEMPCKTGQTIIRDELCLDKDYQDADPPNTTETKVTYEYESLEILGIKEEENKIDLGITMRIGWEDYRIKIIPSMSNPIPKFDYLTGIFIPGFLDEEVFNATQGRVETSWDRCYQ